jgi:exoribonuclease R
LIVHRQLFAILEQSEDTTSKKRYDEIASHCNIKKELAQKASEESNEVFLNLYIQRQFDLETPFHAIGVAVEFGEVSFQVLLPEFGISKRVHIENELGWKVVRVIRSSEVDNSSEGGAVVERLQVETKSGEVKEIAFLTELHLALIPAGIAGKLSYKMVAFDEVPKKDKA